MATATAVRRTLKKVTEAFSPEDDGEPIVYFIDERVLTEWERKYGPIVELGSRFIKTWNRVTKFPITDMPGFEYAYNDSQGLFREQYRVENEEKLNKFMNLDIDISSLIKLPPDFDQVLAAANDLRRRMDAWNPQYFMVEGEDLVMTDKAYEKRNRKAYHTASTPEEKRNLRIAEGIRDAMEKLAEVVPYPHKKLAGEAIQKKSYAHPIPFPLKLVNTKKGWQLIPSPAFVKSGFKGTNTLGYYLPTDQEKAFESRDNNRLGERMKLIRVIGENGFPTGDAILCRPEDIDKHAFGPGRRNRNIVEPGFYNIEGKTYGTPLKGDTAIGAKSFGDKMVGMYHRPN